MSKKYLILSLLAFPFLFLSFALVSNQKESDTFTIYLVRHAEKDLSKGLPGDPPLTQCGRERAKHLSEFLKDINIEAVYSTNYIRTMRTAAPTALDKNITIQEYNTTDLKKFAEILIKGKQDALVVGHSNSTGILAGLLVGQEIGEFDLDTYNLVYQVVVINKIRQNNLFHTAFQCED
ncbi:MAG: histidine phosphatase family protein [Flavobacteriales bacterium]|nr:histidine phosphatase family protein [Flavobacteriales bacterium]